jgi:exosortase/archaeosortase family protein
MKRSSNKKKVKNKGANLYFILLRYLSCLIVSLNGLFIFYLIFTPLTAYSFYFLIKIFYKEAIIQNASIIFNNIKIELVEACIAGAAYFMLYILNLTTPMKPKKRVYSLMFSFVLFFIINIVRIFIFAILFNNNFSLFNILHMITWYFLSAFIVFLVWVITIKKFKIEDIPVRDDIREIGKVIKRK